MTGENKAGTALVIGGAGGIGRAICTRLRDDGYAVVAADRQADGDVPIDLEDEASIERAVKQAARDHGGLAVLVNAAGIHMQKLVVDTSADEWDAIQRVNVRGPFIACRAAAPLMMAAGGGRIVNITTRLGFGNPFSSAYMASKSALWGLTQCLAVELAAYGVTVNAVAPGHVGPGTGMEALFREKAGKLGLSWEEFEAQVHRTIPIGRWCRPEDVAEAVSYVVSPGAGFLTGETINVTGGFTGYGIAPPREARFA